MKLEVRIAKTEDELKEIYNLRYKAYLSAGYTKENMKQLLSDEYDKYSVHVYCVDTDTGAFTGSLRLVLDSILGLPAEDVFDLSGIRSKNADRIMEVGTRATLPGYAKTNLMIVAAHYQFAVENGITNSVALVNPKDMDFYKKLGYSQVGDDKFYEKVNDLASLVIVEPEKITPRYKEMFESMEYPK